MNKNYPWSRGFSLGSPAWLTPWGTVWDNGVWHTWDLQGIGGQNGAEESVERAMAECLAAAARQGFIRMQQAKKDPR